MSKATDLTYRVVKLPKDLQADLRAARDKAGVTNQEIVETAVQEQLPAIVEQLRGFGFRSQGSNAVSTRLPFSDRAKTLQKLRMASQEVDIASVHLLRLCLASAVGARKPRRRKSTSTSSGSRRKAKRRSQK